MRVFRGTVWLIVMMFAVVGEGVGESLICP